MKHSKYAALSYSRSVLFFAILFPVLIFFVFSAPVSAASKTDDEIKAAIDKFTDSYKQKDIAGVMAMYVKSPSTLVIGSGKDEKFLGYAAIKAVYEKDFASWKEITAMNYKIISLSTTGRVAWLAADLSGTYIMKEGPVNVAGTFTAVLKKTGAKWQFAQTHFSLPSDIPMVIVMDFKQIDANQDGKIDYKELSVVIKGLTPEQFKQYDKNNDGYLNEEELRAIWGR